MKRSVGPNSRYQFPALRIGADKYLIMRIAELISEAISRTVYHYTAVGDATRILESGVFELSSAFGSSAEEELQPPGYPYYLSTTRTPLGDYHRHVLHDGVLFVLDGEWFNRRYRGEPVSYYNTGYGHKPRQREAEDRVFSRQPTIGIGGIREIHVLERSPAIPRITSGAARRLLILAHRRGIPAFFYDDAKHWKILSRHRAVRPGKPHRLPPLNPPAQRESPLTRWLELIHKDRVDRLTDPARVLLHDLLNSGSAYWDDHHLSDNMDDGRKPRSPNRKHAVRIIDYMQSQRLRTLRALVLHLISRWRQITGGSFRADEPNQR